MWKVSKCSAEKGNLFYLKRLNMYFTCQNIMQREDFMELNFEVFEMQKWNIPTDRAQRINEKNKVICIFIMFTSRVMVIKISKMTHSLYFCWLKQKISHSLEKYLIASERSYLALLENAMVIGSWTIISKMATLENKVLTQPFFKYFYPQYLTYGNSKAY